ncbi:FxsA family protein [Virgibacillus kekensis]|uniref:FxsA family protein n=1 Tax=Virgibacillus kekensis TaxID=202261 RepID=A0ABV9DFR0_9BACI
MRWLFLTLLVLPALEIGVFIWAGSIIGAWWVVGIILLTGIAGVTIARKQGMETWRRAQQSMNYGQVPANEILDGICIFVGAVFLFSPGFITDTAGFILVLPFTRGPFKVWLQRFIRNRINKGNIIFFNKWQ